MTTANFSQSKSNATKEKEVLITRLFDAPRELVFKAWSEREHLLKWYAPKGATVEFYKFDFSVEGKFQHRIKTPDGYSCMCKGVFHEIQVPNKIEYSVWFCDEDGKFIEASNIAGHECWPDVSTVTVLFEEFNGQTRLTLHQTVSEKIARKNGAYPSWLEMLDKLKELVHSNFV